MEGRIAVGEMLGLYWRSWRGLLVSWPGSPTPLPWREGRAAGSSATKKHFFPPPSVSFVKALQDSLALCLNLHFLMVVLMDTHLPLVSLFQGSRNRVKPSVKQKAACFGITFKKVEDINTENSPLKRQSGTQSGGTSGFKFQFQHISGYENFGKMFNLLCLNFSICKME